MLIYDIDVNYYCTGGALVTLEIMFVSRSSVLLGSDIQETLSNDKTYPGVRKIFELNQNLSSAMMINGESYFEGIPFETLIGEFKNKTNFKKISTVKSIRNKFIKFLSKNTPSSSCDEYVKSLLPEFRDDLIRDIRDVGFDKAVSMRNRRKIPSFLKKYSNYNEEFFDIIPSDVDKTKYNIILWEIFAYELQFEGTGVVFAGFDEKNHFASFFEINLFFNDCGKIVYEDVDSLENIDKPLLKTFAIDEDAYSFITGVHEDFIDFIKDYISNKNNKIVGVLKGSLEDIGVQDVEGVVGIVENLIKNAYCEVENEIIKYRLITIEHTSYSIEDLPIWLIAIFVDLLIYLTGVKQKTSSQQESVSMSADIALMTKNGGFKFIKDDSRIF